VPDDHQVVLVRHGRTEWSEQGRHTGRTDVPLDDVGREQAALLAPRLAGYQFTLVLTSPLSRALDTCRLAGLSSGAQVDPDLAEWDYGAYEGRRTVDIRSERPGWDLWLDGVIDGETVGQVGDRADRVIARVRDLPGAVALFAHGHLLRVLTARWVGLPPTDGGLFALDPAGVNVLGYERENPVVQTLNDLSHLVGCH
jgi:probable phosphoglycerate mutase